MTLFYFIVWFKLIDEKSLTPLSTLTLLKFFIQFNFNSNSIQMQFKPKSNTFLSEVLTSKGQKSRLLFIVMP